MPLEAARGADPLGPTTAPSDSDALRLPTDQAPERLDMPSLRRLGTDRDPDHPAPIQGRRGQVGSPRAVDPLAPAQGVLVHRGPLQARGLMTDADRLKGHRGEHPPAGGGSDLFGQPPGILQIATEPGLQATDPLGTEQAPQLQGPEPPPQRDAPVPEVLPPPVRRGSQVTRLGGHHPDEVLRVPDVVERAVE